MVFEIVIKGTQWLICKPLTKGEPDSDGAVAISGFLFWVGLLIAVGIFFPWEDAERESQALSGAVRAGADPHRWLQRFDVDTLIVHKPLKPLVNESPRVYGYVIFRALEY